MASQIDKTYQWRHLLRKIGENLRTDDVESLMFLFDIPGGIQQEINGNGMKMLQYLEQTDYFSEDSPEKLKQILGEIPRNDLKKHVDQFQNSWKESKKISGSKKMSNKFPTLMTPSAFTVKKDSRLQKTDSFEEGHYPMNNDPHGLCVIISNKDFQSGAEIIEKEKGKVAAEDECPIEEASIKQAQAESLTTGSQSQQLETCPPENEEPENIAAQSENFESGSENASLTAPLSMMQPETLVTASENVSDTTNGPPEESENLTITTTTPEEEQRNNASIESSNFTVQPQDEMTEHATSAQGNLVVNQSTENTSTANTINNEDSELNDTDLSLSNTSLEDVPIEMDDAEFNRQGTEVDEKQLRQTFEWLNFKVVPIHNCTGQKMRSELKAISKMDHKKYDAFICCILSHGYEDGIYGTDWDLLPLSDIRKMFTGERCKGLLEKPKIFFFQACRGSNIDIGSLKFHKATESEYTGMSSAVPPKDQAVGFDGGHLPDKMEPLKKPERVVHPNDCDFLFAQAATKGNKALRHVEKGSWFISTVCEVLRKEAHKKDLLHMMTTVKRLISKKTNYDMGRYKCAPESTDNLSKDLRFKVEETWEAYCERNEIRN